MHSWDMCPQPQSVGVLALSGRNCSRWQRQLAPVAAPLLGGRGDASAISQQKYLRLCGLGLEWYWGHQVLP